MGGSWVATILLAGDDFAALSAIGATIESEGHRLVEVPDGFEAVEIAPKCAPDLVLLDSSMSVFNGFETARLLRDDPDIPAAVPILILSGSDVDLRTIERAGATAAIGKGISASELRDLLVKYLGPKAAP